MKILKHNLWQFIIAIDQLVGVLLGLVTWTYSWADETISSKAYRINYKKRWKLMESFVNTLFFFDYEYRIVDGVEVKIKHCQLSYENEKERGHNPVELRDKE